MMIYDYTNVFARILSGEITCKKILEDNYFLSFYDINPRKKVHALVISKGAYIDYSDFFSNATPDEINGFFQGILKVIKYLDLTTSGYRLILNTGINGGQEVPHLHVHILGGEPIGPMVYA